jgi:DNA-binding response OmpR family regulator
LKPLILIVDDDGKLNDLLAGYLGDFGYRAVAATHPEEGLAMLRKKGPDLVILDVMLPGMSGFDVCRAIRKTSNVPIIMLTARGEVADRVVGLELGADDYLPKPFEPRELVARIQSVLRRKPRSERPVRRYGRLRIDFPKRKAFLDGDPVSLTTGEFEALRLLASSPGEVMDRDRLLQALRGMDSEAYDRSVDITISRLRRKLGDDPGSPEFIKTVRSAGYLFVAEESEDETVSS